MPAYIVSGRLTKQLASSYGPMLKTINIDSKHMLVAIQKDNCINIVGNLTSFPVNRPEIQAHVLSPNLNYEGLKKTQSIVFSSEPFVIKYSDFLINRQVTDYLYNHKNEFVGLVHTRAPQNIKEFILNNLDKIT